jgi:hypothetical protein
MAVDDNGNARIDFAWGNMPMQPNHGDGAGDYARWSMSPYPGDGMAEYYVGADASYARSINGVPTMGPNIPGISNQLQALDSHVIAMRHWKHYPEASTDGDLGYALTVDWWDVVPAYQYPNIVGVSEAEAIKQLKECGVNPALLVPMEFDAPDEFKYIGYDSGTDTYYDPINAPGADNPGVIFYRYYEPNDEIGTHWDGRPWLAKESEGMVLDTDFYPSEAVPVGEYEPNYFSYWHSFVVINTTDPTKDSFQWWN